MGTVADRRKYAAPLAVLAALALGIFAGRASVLLGDSHIQYGGDAQLVEQPALLLEEYQVWKDVVRKYAYKEEYQ